jgi:hypothetical protein
VFTKRQLLIGALFVLSVTVGFYSFALFRSRLMMRPEMDIQASLLKQTPIGMNKSEVQAFVKQQGWLNTTDMDFIRLPGPPHSGPFSFIDGTLGRYSLPFSRTVVHAHWMFGPNDRLIEVNVEKITFERQIPFFPLTK